MKMILEFDLSDHEERREAELAWRGAEIAHAVSDHLEAARRRIKDRPADSYTEAIEDERNLLLDCLTERGVLGVLTGE